MANKMLIDASHPEETRVVVLRGNKVQEFDFEAADKKPLRGNIYLAKVTRVEPSLQAAFVDYGGNRHGFLAFAEIHPDYYQIPVADRLALLEEENRAHLQAEDEEPRPQQQTRGRRSRRRRFESAEKRQRTDETLSEAAPDESLNEARETESSEALATFSEEFATQAAPEAIEIPSFETAAPEPVIDAEIAAAPEIEQIPEAQVEATEDRPLTEAEPAAAEHETLSVDPSGFGVIELGTVDEGEPQAVEQDHEAKARRQDERDEAAQRLREARHEPESEEEEEEEEAEDEEQHVEHIGGDAMEEVPYRAPRMRRQYKIQEVIKRRQVLLVQVVKEERGNKGAALTTYLSLAGRFCVLMPNTARGGGISRKITDGADRRRLKEIVQELEVPEGMGVILRTAGATRTKPEVKRDFEYLLRMWESVRELTLRSSAPNLVYEEGSLIKRAMRDLYGQDIDEVLVAGAEAHREAQAFMRMLMPSHARNVKLYREPTPIFAEAGVEAQLDAMFSNQVTLKSGGYLVINQTEALVAIDVNSGRSTREHNIEDTALRTNLEAADEVARQLRLRDLAGLIVVDFIDMEESRNNRSVERRIKEALKNDRARIQVGRISHFGLLEMSRQRIRAGVVEGSTAPCPHCAGAGTIRSTASIALHVLRVLEEALVRSAAHDVVLRTRSPVALYILNQKRAHLQAMEHRFGVHIMVAADDSLTGANYHALERGEPASGLRARPSPQHLRVDSLPPELAQEEAEEAETTVDFAEARSPMAEGRPRASEEPEEAELAAGGAEGDEEDADAQPRSRRRRRRRGRGSGRDDFAANLGEAPEAYPEQLQRDEQAQPSDEGLAFMAQLAGQPTADGETRRPTRGRGRGPGRWTRSTPLAPEYRNPQALPEGEPVAAEAVTEEPRGEEPLESPAQVAAAAEPAQEAIAVESAPEAPQEVKTIETPLPEPETARESAPIEIDAAAEVDEQPAQSHAARSEVVITEADPSAPKKGGWWQRARATFGG
ncbi:Rne/Rng family ribonuclease [Methylocystis bryophila]|uniref:Ribonuclease E n=1 Tax=Methylocystis bryophila TaxID=655015 RepID=A0A1W6MZB3_9HYPH|nr:ribonuclease E/G [Methylocystis bryophila]ARN82908.1 ribonuclease [Methylocystis bryophila]BDV39187.1 ribonuclease E [Methylocystis bryophila]